MFFSFKAYSDKIVVTTGSDSISGSLRDAISNAQNGDEIYFSNKLTEINILKQINIEKSLTITGNPNLVLHGKGLDTIFFRLFEISGDLPITVNLNNLKLGQKPFMIGDTVSTDTNGALILMSNTNATVHINSCYLTREKWGSGGWVRYWGKKVNGQNGGGIAQYGGTLNITNSTFSQLVAGGAVYWGAGGAVCQFGGILNIENCTFYNNTAGRTSRGNFLGSGSAIHTQNGTLNITNCTFVEQETYFWWTEGVNTYSGHTYAINNYESEVLIKNSIFYHNKKYDVGGGFNSGGYNVFEQIFSPADSIDIFSCNPGFMLKNDEVELSDSSFWIPVCALQTSGCAVDGLPVDGNGAPDTDQRGFPRYNTPDIGAFELNGCIPIGKAFLPEGIKILCQNSENQLYTTHKLNGANRYSWEISPSNAGTISGVDTSAIVHFNANFTGTAQITVKGENSCGYGQLSDILKVEINDCTSSITAKEMASFNIYPNPSTGTINLQVNNNQLYNRLEIINSLGQIVFRKEYLNKSKEQIRFDNKGFYYFRLMNANSCQTRKIIIK
jgi:hypothetical protein